MSSSSLFCVADTCLLLYTAAQYTANIVRCILLCGIVSNGGSIALVARSNDEDGRGSIVATRTKQANERVSGE